MRPRFDRAELLKQLLFVTAGAACEIPPPALGEEHAILNWDML